MSDHIGQPSKRQGRPKSIGVRELKTHAAGILREVREARASYLLTHRGRPIGVILPVDSEDEAARVSGTSDAAGAWEAFLRAGQKLERRFAARVSGVRLLSDMRR
jgi:prevent-host-death family protein